jgi:hypothetical protein
LNGRGGCAIVQDREISENVLKTNMHHGGKDIEIKLTKIGGNFW